jgi:membrane fusion protein (multidrug efflux system)
VKAFLRCCLFALLPGLLLAACSETKPDTPAAAPAAGVDTVRAFILKAEAVTKSLNLPAELLPAERVQLYAKVPGYVRRMAVDIGSRVRRGQLLATLEAPELTARVAEAEAGVQEALVAVQNSQDAYRRLARAGQGTGAISGREIEQARNRLRADSAAWQARRGVLRSVRQQQAYLTLTAPFAGVVTKRNADPGALVGSTSAPLLELENTRRLRLRVAVPEGLTGSQLPGQTVQFTVTSLPDKTFPGTLVRKSETIDPKTRTELWEFAVDNAAGELKSGLFANATLGLTRGGASLLVPPSAVVTSLERKFVIRVKNGRTEWVDVTTGLGVGAQIEVFGPLAMGDTLVRMGTEELSAERRVVPAVN